MVFPGRRKNVLPPRSVMPTFFSASASAAYARLRSIRRKRRLVFHESPSAPKMASIKEPRSFIRWTSSYCDEAIALNMLFVSQMGCSQALTGTVANGLFFHRGKCGKEGKPLYRRLGPAKLGRSCRCAPGGNGRLLHHFQFSAMRKSCDNVFNSGTWRAMMARLSNSRNPTTRCGSRPAKNVGGRSVGGAQPQRTS